MTVRSHHTKAYMPHASSLRSIGFTESQCARQERKTKTRKISKDERLMMAADRVIAAILAE